jgi:Mor family transcriptional regulator
MVNLKEIYNHYTSSANTIRKIIEKHLNESKPSSCMRRGGCI